MTSSVPIVRSSASPSCSLHCTARHPFRKPLTLSPTLVANHVRASGFAMRAQVTTDLTLILHSRSAWSNENVKAQETWQKTMTTCLSRSDRGCQIRLKRTASATIRQASQEDCGELNLIGLPADERCNLCHGHHDHQRTDRGQRSGIASTTICCLSIPLHGGLTMYTHRVQGIIQTSTTSLQLFSLLQERAELFCQPGTSVHTVHCELHLT
jgi:hypothetical protein